LWIIKLTLTTDEDEQWNVLTEHLEKEKVLMSIVFQNVIFVDQIGLNLFEQK
jgi:hypothetical protein